MYVKQSGKQHICVVISLSIVWQVCEYNVPHGKLNRGLLVVDSFSAFADGGTAVDESMREKALVLGWCVEWLQVQMWKGTRPIGKSRVHFELRKSVIF